MMAALYGHADYAQSRANPAGCKRAGIALRHHAAALGHQLRSEPPDALVGCLAFFVYQLRFPDERSAKAVKRAPYT